MEVLFDQRADSFCLVTSDSDFAYMCRKLRERGATVRIVGETKTPLALRNASDEFFEWVALELTLESFTESVDKGPEKDSSVKTEQTKTESPKPAIKRRPKFVMEAVALLASDTPEGKVGLSPLGAYLKRADPAFSPKVYGHSGLLSMVKTYDLLELKQEDGGSWSVSLKPKAECFC